MTLTQFLFETGPEGTALSNANSGSVASSIGTGSTAFEAAKKAHGTFGARFTNGAGSATYRRWPLAAPNTQWQFSGVVTLPASAVTGNVLIASFPRTDGNGRLGVYVNASGDLGISDVAGANLTTVVTGLSWGSKYRVSIQAVGGSATVSQVTVKVYSGTTAWTTQVGSTYTSSTRNMGTEQVVGVDLGITATQANSYIVGWDDIQLNDGAGSEIGDYAPVNVVPTISAITANQNVAAAATVNLSVTATDPDGSIASYAWTYDFPSSGAPALTGASTATPSFTAGSAGSLYILRCTVTDNGGATATATTEVRVPVSGATAQRAVSQNGSGTGSWTIVGGSATDGAALSDESDTTYLESPTLSASEVSRRQRIVPGAVKATGQFKERLWLDASSTHTVTVRLYEGNTLRQSWTQTVTTSPAEYTFALSNGTVTAIGDWGNLYVEVAATT